jgi:hypothetical protein
LIIEFFNSFDNILILYFNISQKKDKIKYDKRDMILVVPDRTLGGVYLLSALIMQWCISVRDIA